MSETSAAVAPATQVYHVTQARIAFGDPETYEMGEMPELVVAAVGGNIELEVTIDSAALKAVQPYQARQMAKVLTAAADRAQEVLDRYKSVDQ